MNVTVEAKDPMVERLIQWYEEKMDKLMAKQAQEWKEKIGTKYSKRRVTTSELFERSVISWCRFF